MSTHQSPLSSIGAIWRMRKGLSPDTSQTIINHDSNGSRHLKDSFNVLTDKLSEIYDYLQQQPAQDILTTQNEAQQQQFRLLVQLISDIKQGSYQQDLIKDQQVQAAKLDDLQHLIKQQNELLKRNEADSSFKILEQHNQNFGNQLRVIQEQIVYTNAKSLRNNVQQIDKLSKQVRESVVKAKLTVEREMRLAIQSLEFAAKMINQCYEKEAKTCSNRLQHYDQKSEEKDRKIAELQKINQEMKEVQMEQLKEQLSKDTEQKVELAKLQQDNDFLQRENQALQEFKTHQSVHCIDHQFQTEQNISKFQEQLREAQKKNADQEIIVQQLKEDLKQSKQQSSQQLSTNQLAEQPFSTQLEQDVNENILVQQQSQSNQMIIDQLMQQVVTLQDKLSQAADQQFANKNEIAELLLVHNNEVQKLKSEFEGTKLLQILEVSQLKQQLALQQNSTAESCDKQVKELQNEVSEMKRAYDSLQDSRNQDLSSQQQKFNTQEQEISKLKVENARLTSQIYDFNIIESEQNTKFDQMKSEVNLLVENNEAEKQNIEAQMEIKLQMKQNQINELQTELEEVKLEHFNLTVLLQKDSQLVYNRAEKAESQIIQLEQQLSKMRKETELHMSSLNESQAKNDTSLKQKLEQAFEQVLRLRKENDDLRLQSNEIQAEMTEKVKQLEVYEQDSKTLHEQRKVASVAQKEVGVAKQRWADTAQQLLQEQMKAEKLAFECDQLKQENNQLQQQFSKEKTLNDSAVLVLQQYKGDLLKQKRSNLDLLRELKLLHEENKTMFYKNQEMVVDFNQFSELIGQQSVNNSAFQSKFVGDSYYIQQLEEDVAEIVQRQRRLDQYQSVIADGTDVLNEYIK